jgi:hypothetical protein
MERAVFCDYRDPWQEVVSIENTRRDYLAYRPLCPNCSKRRMIFPNIVGLYYPHDPLSKLPIFRIYTLTPG